MHHGHVSDAVASDFELSQDMCHSDQSSVSGLKLLIVGDVSRPVLVGQWAHLSHLLTTR